jgi:hypothetical protein
MNPTAALPYELHTHGSSGFVIFNVGDQIALPLVGLARATLRTTCDRDELVLEFQEGEVVIEGHRLALLLDHLLAGRVKKISRGRDSVCEITTIRVAAH